jgi:type VI secretion system secreted protein Hcp
MALDIHIKFDGVEGESTHQDHKGEIDVLSWNWGVDVPMPAGAGTGAAVSKPVASALRFMHSYDKASPLLARASARGNVIKQVVLTARKSGEGQKDFLKVTMKDVLITSVQVSASESMVESVALSPRSIAFDYAAQDAKGTLGPPVSFSWDLAKGIVK